MFFHQISCEEQGCLSYIIGSSVEGSASVVDPQATIDPYLEYAKSHGLKITHIFDTHVHADHVSGTRTLAAATGAPIYMHEAAPVRFPVNRLREGERLRCGEVSVEVLHTPGHTPDSMSLLVADGTRTSTPWLVLTGDTLMVGDVGRPDLVLDAPGEETVLARAQELYESLTEKLLKLDDALEVFPAHYGCSPCGGNQLSGKTSSTLGFERRFNIPLLVPSKEAFVRLVLRGLRPPPPDYQRIKRQNLGEG